MRSGVALVMLLAACGPKGAAKAPEPEAPEARSPLAEALAAARASHDAGDDEACNEALGGIDEAWLGSELDAQVLALAKTCGGISDDFCDHYVDDSLYCTLKLAVDLAPRRAYGAAAAAPCGFGGHAVSVALPGDADRCVAIEPGAGAELDELDDEGNAPAGACPRLVFLERDGEGARVVEAGVTSESFLDSPSDCCNASHLAALREGDALRIVLHSDGPARDCFGGTASVDHFDVYRVEGDRLEVEAQLGVLMH
jgi:hypothetical protein